MNHPSVQPLSLHAPNGFDYRAGSGSHSSGPEVPFSTGGELSMSPLQSSQGSSSASPNSLSSGYALLSHQNQYTLNPNISYNMVPQGPAAASSLYSAGGPYVPAMLPSSIDFRPRLSSLSGGTLPTSARDPSDHVPSSPSGSSAIRGDYVTGPPAGRQAFSSTGGLYHLSSATHSPLSNIPRNMEAALGHDHSPASAFLIAPHESALPASGELAPPFGITKSFAKLRDRNGGSLTPEITARIEKGFFQVHGEWVCYRRNYFTVLCTFDLGSTSSSSDPVFVQRSGNQLAQIRSFCLTIAAKADGEDGKSIDLVQHTPKRDKGPMTAPDRKEVKPNPGGNLSSGFHGAGSSYGLGHHEYDHSSPPALDNQTVASFERMQFKKATANNGKRRAAQQYFYIIVELYGRIQNNQGQEESIKLAHQVSSKIVVRGRSPGHYQDERRGSASQGGGAGQIGYSDGNFGQGGPITSSLNMTGGDGFSRSGLPSGQSAIGRSQFLHHGYLAPSTSILHGSSTRHLSDELMDVDSHNGDPFYSHHDFGGLPSPPTPRVSHSLRQSSNASPNSLQSSGIGYLTPLSIKEELKLSTRADEDRLQTPREPPSQPPTEPPSQPSPWAIQRDCRSFGLHVNRDIYTEIV